MKTKLKVCPFCGNVPERVVVHCIWHPDDTYYIVQCTNKKCKIQPFTVAYKCKASATKAWNSIIKEISR